jgi:formylglycine-generating enzyme required for sulfatase activity/DNA-binding winged helix-turn-helix (wHTH) protein
LLYAFEGYGLDTDRRELRRADKIVPLQPQVFDLLEYLIRNRNQVVSKDDLLAAIWNGRFVSESTLASRISSARTAIGDDGESQRLIRTHSRRGIRFVGDVREESAAAATQAADPISGKPSPYRGLAAMEERDVLYFFGRKFETIEVLQALTEPGRLAILLGNSGVGKSSLAQAGVLAALKSQTWPGTAGEKAAWPQCLKKSRRWRYFKLKPGPLPISSLVETILDTWDLERNGSEWSERCIEWIEKLLAGCSLHELLDQTGRRYGELELPEPPAYFVYIDQGEELYVRAEERQRRSFSRVVAQAVGAGHLRGLMSLRADFFGELQKDGHLYKVHRQINVPPMREAELRDVVSRPARLLGVRFENDHLAANIAKQAAEESAKDAGALPLLCYLLDHMWAEMVRRDDGVLRLSGEAVELGSVLVQRANTFLADHPSSEESLRRMFTLKLVTVRQGEEPTRRRAMRSEFTGSEWKLVSDLADHPCRLLVTASSKDGEPYAEVAHEAIFKRWDKLQVWIASEREFLGWRSGLEAVRRVWQAAPAASKDDALLMGLGLAQAQKWLAKRSDDIADADCAFIIRSGKAANRQHHRRRLLIGAPVLALILGVIGWTSQDYLETQWRQYTLVRPYILKDVRPYVLSAATERALEPSEAFTECAANCPQMVVMPAGRFMMGSPKDEPGHNAAEEPRHSVMIAKRFAIGKFELTFAEWDTCVTYGDCNPNISDSGTGRGREPVINIDWQDAKQYVAWLSRVTGKPYRLASEAEWEYAARGGTITTYSWGNDVGKGNANCVGCGTAWDRKQAAPVGTFPANPFGLFDMEGNIAEYVEDCLHGNYDGAPDDGTAWTTGDCKSHVIRGGSWLAGPFAIRTAARFRSSTLTRGAAIGFRVARTLEP